jgi:hypothetical protein
MSFAKVKYIGATPGTDTNDYTLFNSIVSRLPGNWAAVFGVKKVVISIKHSHGGTLKWYKTDSDPTLHDATTPDSGVTWSQMGSLTVAAPASTEGTLAEVFVEGDKHTKIDWTNGGTAQTSFIVGIALADERAAL